ncbi:MAG: hypothetical protein H6816_09555 [Phycisphaerales bacterium]|nr:hypothetical protein [Phycisphaerales bacterium]
MSTPLHCFACGTDFSAMDVHADEQRRCPNCGTLAEIPAVRPAPPTVTSAAFAPRPAPGPSSSLGMAAMICGLLSLFMCAPLGLIAIVLAIITLVLVRREPARFAGKGFAIVGLCGGIVSILLVTVIFLPGLSRTRELSKRFVCQSNMQAVGTACRIYANDHDGDLPPGVQVLIDSGDVMPKQLHCPSAATNAATPTVAYIYIAGQGGIDDPRNVLLYEPPENHDSEGANVLFADGHVQFIRPYSEVERRVAETKARIAQRPAPK